MPQVEAVPSSPLSQMARHLTLPGPSQYQYVSAPLPAAEARPAATTTRLTTCYPDRVEGPHLVPGLPHVILLESRALIQYQAYHMLS